MTNLKMTCPVCDHEITFNNSQKREAEICPNCEQDLAVIRLLQELPTQPATPNRLGIIVWAVVIIVVSITLQLSWLSHS